MSDSDRVIIATSKEFIDLCRAQIALLNQAMGASWSAVYVTPALVENSGSKKLIQVTADPEEEQIKQENQILPRIWDGLSKIAPRLPSADRSSIDYPISGTDLVKQRQIVLPLLHEETVMGLLVTRRCDREWNRIEYDCVEKIATTIAIARRMDREKDWYRERLEQQQQEANLERDRLEDLLHQLRNPVTALRTFSKLLLKRFSGRDRNSSVAQSMLRESDRLQELLEQFQQQSQLEQQEEAVNLIETRNVASLPAKNLFNLVPTTITAVLEPLLVSATAIATEREIELKSAVKADLNPVKANPEALREVLSNIIDNALKYTPKGGQIEIKTGIDRLKKDLNWQGIAIKNTGTEIPIEDRDKIFERHYRGVQQEGDIQGSGLGLAIAKQLIDRMAGEIELISPAGKSEAATIFIIWLQVFST